MTRGFARFVAALVLAMVVQVPVAHAWFNVNSPGDGSPDGYGTHDWVLDEAVRLAGDQGDWVDLAIALPATDDPDTSGTPKALHGFYDGISRMRGGPQTVTDLYYDAVLAYRQGDLQRASLDLGWLSHYYADILQPFHTNSLALGRPVMHLNYEAEVDLQTNSPGENREWITSREPTGVVDIRSRAVAAGLYSRGCFPALLAEFSPFDTVDAGSAVVTSITAQMLDRAVHDLADVVRSIPEGTGISPAPASMKADMSRHAPATESIPAAYVVCRDAQGRPIQGVAVTFTWNLPSGPITSVRYSDPQGVARDYHTVGADEVGVRIRVVAVAASSGTSKTSTTYYTPVLALGSGTQGLIATVSTPRPKQRTVVIARAIVRDLHQVPLPGLTVTFTWHYRTKTVVGVAYTDAAGVARYSRNIGTAKRGTDVRVTARVLIAARSASTKFTPR